MNALSVWLMASRPRTWTASWMPVLTTTALSYTLFERTDLLIFFSTLFCAWMIQIATNLFNDALDFKKGADTPERVGPTRVTSHQLLNYKEVMGGGCITLFIGFISAIPLLEAGGAPFSCFLVLSFLLSFLYTGGPYPLAYIGMGELFVFLFFGLFFSEAVFFLQEGKIEPIFALLGAELGLFAAAIIAINNLRDILQDEKAHKRTLAVVFGEEFAKKEVFFFLFAPFVLHLFWPFLINKEFDKTLYYSWLLPFCALYFSLVIAKGIEKIKEKRELNPLLGASALLHTAFGVLLLVGLFFDRFLGSF